MVVVPEETHVELTYGRTGVEYLSYALTLLGIVGLVLLWRRPPFRFAPEPERRRVPSPGPSVPPGPFTPDGPDRADAAGPPPSPGDAEREAPG
jgi:hypothetical protein